MRNLLMFLVTSSLMLLASAPASANDSSSDAYDFSAADAQYALRSTSEDGVAAISKALSLYREALDQLSDDDLLYAVAQISRLYAYLGDMVLPMDASKQRMRTFDNCLDTLKKYIEPGKFGRKTPEYYYFKITCLALWGKSANPLQALIRIPTLKSAIDEGMKLDTRLEGGGILRMVAAVYLNQKAKPLGLYRPKEAADLIDRALKSEEIEDRAYPYPISGADMLENYYFQAISLWENDRKDDAITLLEDTIAEYEELIEMDALFEGREPETLIYVDRTKNLLKQYTQDNQ
ncbi:MAG: hypothetical protein OYH77_07715 [Pseudomonadota bacterium]|nr:hypothetical protein [Pseudomonadota bacterium]